jgi:tRNA pseudouridine32 synthase/23S rRNA pseudouridine746 synthase
MNKGAVWIKKKSGGMKRLRRASASLLQGDRIEIYYDSELLSLKPPEARCLSDQQHYSVWHKPAGLLAQGTNYGDHCSLMRQAELYFRSSREIFLVHRLDREASGVMVLAHSKDAAAKLSGLFQKNLVIKRYRIEVPGNLGERGLHGTIELPLDGKASFTEYDVTAIQCCCQHINSQCHHQNRTASSDPAAFRHDRFPCNGRSEIWYRQQKH